MSQTPTDPSRLDGLGSLLRSHPISGPALGAYDAVTRERPPVIGEDRRQTWRKVSDWIFDGVFPEDQTNFYGSGTRPSAQQKANRERADLERREGRPYIDKDAGDARRLAADILVGLADQGDVPLHETEAQDLAAEIMVDQAEQTVTAGDAPPERVREAQLVIEDQAIRQQVAKEEAERGLSQGASEEDVTRRLVEFWADGVDQDQAIAEMQAGGWDFSKVSKTHLDRLAAEVEILLDEGEFHKAKALAMARMALVRGGGPEDANATPYDVLLDEVIAGQTQGMSRAEAFSISGTDAFLSTIRGLGRLSGMGYTTEKDRDVLEKMAQASFQEHPVSSVAGSFAGGFVDPVFFGLSMGIAKAPITAAQRSRYAASLTARGVPAEVAEQMGKAATLETIATARLERYFLGRGLSGRTAQAAAGLIWNATDAMVSNAAAEGIVAAGERASPLEIAMRTAAGGATGLVMGVALDRAFRGIARLSRTFGGTVPRETGAKLDAVADYVANAGKDAQLLAGQLRHYMTQARRIRDQLGRKLTNAEAEELASTIGFDLDQIVGMRAVQQRAQQTGRAGSPEISPAGAADARKSPDAQGDSGSPRAGDNLESDPLDGDPLQAEGEERGVLRPERPAPTPEQRAAQEAKADAAVRRQAEAAERGEAEPGGAGLDPDELERRAERAGITKRTPEPTAEQRRQQEADADAWAKREAEKAEAEGGRFPGRVTLDQLAEIEAPSADMPDAAPDELVAAARFQRDNLDTVDHRDDDWVRVRVPVDDLVNAGTRDVASEAEVAEYAAMDPATRPPPAAGPLKGDDSGALTIVDGQRRVAAARARGETEVEVYMPAWVARDRGLGQSDAAPLPTAEEADEFARGAEAARDARTAPLPSDEDLDAVFGPESRVDEYIRETELESMTDEELVELRRTMLPKIGSKTEREGAELAVMAIDRVRDARRRAAGGAGNRSELPKGSGQEAGAFPARLDGDDAKRAFFGRYERDPELLLSYTDEPLVLVDLPVAEIPDQNLGLGGELVQEKLATAMAGHPATRPPIMAVEVGRGNLFIPDGNHRVAAARARGEATIRAYVPESVAARRGLSGESRSGTPEQPSGAAGGRPFRTPAQVRELAEEMERNARRGEVIDRTPAGYGPSEAAPPVARAGKFGMFTGPDGKRPVTGRPVEIVGWRGSGRPDDAGVYAEGVEGPILGRGIYVAASQRQAATYGPDVAETRVRLENPYVIEEVGDLRRLGGGKPVPTETAGMVPYMAEVAARLRRDGHDGVIVQLDDAGDNTPAGASNKRLRRLFEHTQAVAFNREAVPTTQVGPAAAPDTTPPGPRITAIARSMGRQLIPEDVREDADLGMIAQGLLLKNAEFQRRAAALDQARAKTTSMDFAERTAADETVAREEEAIGFLIEELMDDFVFDYADEVDAARDRARKGRETVATIGPDRPTPPGARSGIAPAERQAKGPRSTAKPPPPSRAPAVGRETQVIVPDGPPLPARYAIVESEDLIPSHDARDRFQPNAYGDVNERPYNDPTEGRNLREGVHRIAENPQPAFLLTDTPSPLDGPPITTPDLVVLGGNARAMAQQLAYRRAGEPMARIATATRDAAERFGIDPAAVDAFQEPILVRMVDAAAAGRPGELSRTLNQGMTAARTPDADAISRAARLTPEAVNRLAGIIGDDTLAQVFNDRRRSQTLSQALFESGVFSVADYDGMTDNRGLLTQAGRRTVESALLGSAIPDVRRLAETPPAIRNALTRALPALSTLRARDPGWVDTLGHALDALKEYRESGARSFEDLLSQTSIIPQPWRDDPRALTLARAIQRDSPTTLAARLGELAALARDEASGQERMFGAEASGSFEEILTLPRGSAAQGALDWETSEMSTRGPGGRPVPRGTGPDQAVVEDPRLGIVPVDDNRRMSAADGPESGVEPGLPRQPPAAWLKEPPKTKPGKKIVGRIRSDPRGLKVGTRSIAEELSRVLDVFVRQTREQTSRRSPAHYAPRPHLIRTRSSAEPAWMFHEQGHAISAILRDANPQFLKDHEEHLIALSQWPGSMASKISPEEGFAEFVRRFITSPDRIEQWPPGPRIIAAIQSANPRIMDAVRDAARAFDAYMARDLPARWRSYQHDVKGKPFSPARVINRAMTDFVSRGWASERAQNEALRALRKEGDLATMRKVRAETTDTAGDMRQAYQSLNHIHQMVGVALEGPGKGKTGGQRVHATVLPDDLAQTWLARPAGGRRRTASVMLGAGERKILDAAGFKLPEEPARHGDVVQLAGKSVKEAIAPIPRDKWADFEFYGQAKATLARIVARAKEGEPFPYQTQGEGTRPADLYREVTRLERENPAFPKVFADLEEISSAVLLLQVMSGESTAAQAVKAKAAFEHYLPLTRQGEGGPRQVRSGSTPSPTAGIHRSNGSVNPAEPILMAMARKIDSAVNAYYWNRFALSPIVFAESLRARKDVPMLAKAAADRVATRLKLDAVKVATATPEEVQKAIYDYIVREVRQGNTLFNLEPEELVSLSPDDIAVTDGFDLWRRRPPKAINVLAPTVNGQRLYYQVLDEDLYRIFANDDRTLQVGRVAEQLFGAATQGLKNQITQTFTFALRSLVRDAPTAMLFGNDPGALVPGYYHAVGALARMTGRAPESMSNPELLSRVFRQTTAEDFARQRSAAMELLTEGLVPGGWRDMNLLHRTLNAPGIAFRVLTKPIEMAQVLTGQRAFANFAESAPREGAYLVAKRKGLSDEAAQLAADTTTGNFSERPLSATAHALYRASGFLNPAVQIFGQQARMLADPDPRRVAAAAAVKMGSMATWTGLAWAVWELASNDEEKRRRAEQPERERLTHMHVKGFRMPFDYGIMGGIQSFVWNSLDQLAGMPGVSRKALAIRVIEGTLPQHTLDPIELLPWTVRAGVEAKVNYSFYRQGPIEPPYMAFMEPGDRYFDTTPDLYRWIGRAANVSPVRVDYFVRNGFGVQVDNAIDLIDRAAQGLEITEMADLPLVDSLFSREPMGWNSRSVQDASALARKYDSARNRLEQLEEAGRTDDRTVAELTAILDRLAPVKDAMLEVSRLWGDSKQAAQADPDAARDLKRRMIDVAREGLVRMEEAGRSAPNRDRDATSEGTP